ncbi:MAG: caspase family protein [Alphaproteobacteria bacterium]
MGMWRRLLVIALLVLPLLPPAEAVRAQTRTLIPVPQNKAPNVELEVSVDRHELRIGDTVTICFKASRRGFVTLWNVSAEAKVARVFPNAFQPATADAMAVDEGREYCAGKQGDAFRFQVAGPPGIDDLYLIWTQTADLQPAPAAMGDAEVWARSLEQLRGALAERWGTAKTSFDIVPPGGPTPPSLDLPPGGPTAAPPPAAPPPAVSAPPPVVVAPPSVAVPPPAGPRPSPTPLPTQLLPSTPSTTPAPAPPAGAVATPLPSQLLPRPPSVAPAPTPVVVSPPPAVAPPPAAPPVAPPASPPSVAPAPGPVAVAPPPAVVRPPSVVPAPAVAPPPAVAPRPTAPPPAGPRTDQAEAPKVWVLAMGSNVKPLTKTNQDAKLFATVIKVRRNLPDEQVMVLTDVYRDDFKRGMDWLREKAGPRDIAIIFYSGHGVQVRDPTNTSADGLDEAFVPYEFQTKAKPSGRDLIWSHQFANWVNALRTDNVITVIDACHSAGLYRSLDSAIIGAKPKAYRPPADLDLTMPADEREPKTRAMGGRGRPVAKGVLLAAARRDQSALEAEDGGVFVMTLLRLIYNSPDGTLDAYFTSAQARVHDSTKEKQSPQAVGDLETARRLRLKK